MLTIAPEAARNTDAVELARDIVDAAERMDVPLYVGGVHEPWTPSYFTYLTNHSAETTALERAAAQLVAFRSGWEVVKAAGDDSHRKARAHFEGEQHYGIAR